jgi:AAA15 family ATPase/GTPase
MTNKIKEAKEILEGLKLPINNQNQICALTLLALCGIRPNDAWHNAKRKSLILSTEIMEFIKDYYDVEYKSGTRESFRKEAINPFISYGLVEKNPDNPDLPPTSPRTHYAISLLALNTIKKYKTPEWKLASENFIKYKILNYRNLNPKRFLKSINIINYKSIVDDTIELGRFNIFIGVNGSGKTNILEALATIGAERGKDLTFDGLYSRGVRIARPDLIISSFLESNQKSSIEIGLVLENNENLQEYKYSLSPTNLNDIYSKWVNLSEEEFYPISFLDYASFISKSDPGITASDLIDKVAKMISNKNSKRDRYFDDLLSEYAIFDLNTKSLRGISPADSKKTPLGINGEGLDLLIASLNSKERSQLNRCLSFFDWLGEIVADKDDKLKLMGLKPGRSISTLYFKDKYMKKENNIFSAENSNEGVLHVLFYLALFISNKTPKLLAVDNIETALNPRLCQVLIKELIKLSEETGKQALITTHNPAILDGLNLLDDEQRLFEVYRNQEGNTKTRRIKFKSDLSDKKFKLSEMWLKGLLGAVPKNF